MRAGWVSAAACFSCGAAAGLAGVAAGSAGLSAASPALIGAGVLTLILAGCVSWRLVTRVTAAFGGSAKPEDTVLLVELLMAQAPTQELLSLLNGALLSVTRERDPQLTLGQRRLLYRAFGTGWMGGRVGEQLRPGILHVVREMGYTDALPWLERVDTYGWPPKRMAEIAAVRDELRSLAASRPGNVSLLRAGTPATGLLHRAEPSGADSETLVQPGTAPQSDLQVPPGRSGPTHNGDPCSPP